jgi:uncharacterized protein YdiU (UPF0061 family)
MELIETDAVDFTGTFTALTHFAAHHDTASSSASSSATSSDPLGWLQPGAVLPLTTVLTSAQAFHCVTPDCVTAWSGWLHRYSVLLSQSLQCSSDEWFAVSFTGAISDSQRTGSSDATTAAANVAAAVAAAVAVPAAAAEVDDSSNCNEAHTLAQSLAASIVQLYADNETTEGLAGSIDTSSSSDTSSYSSSSSGVIAQRVRCRANVMAKANPWFVLRKAARDDAVTAAVVHGDWQLFNELQQRLAQPCCCSSDAQCTPL